MRGRPRSRTAAVAIAISGLLSGSGPAVLAAQEGRELGGLRGRTGIDPEPGTLLATAARLSIERAPLADALSRVSESSQVQIAFSPSLLPADILVDCACAELHLARTLDRLLADTDLGYVEVGLQVLVVRKDGAPDAPQQQAPQVPQTGSITGVVSDVENGQLLESALVTLDDAEAGVLTNESGRYLIRDVPAGPHQVTFQIIGYENLTLDVEVVSGEAVEVNAELTVGALPLQELIVTGVAAATPRVKLPFSVERLNVADLPVPAISAEGFLAGKLAGVKVLRGRGTPGTSAHIMLRGATSIMLSQSPLIIVDGIPGSLSDLVSLDIEAIEVVKGAAGASLYGSRAANGIVQVWTKRGTGFGGRDYSQMQVRTEGGMQRLMGDISLSRNHPWKTDESGHLVGADGEVLDVTDPEIPGTAILNGASTATSFQTSEWPSHLPSYDHVERIYSHAVYQTHHGAAEGRNGATNYRISFDVMREPGVLSRWNDGFRRTGARINMDQQLRPNLDLAISAAYTQSELHFPVASPFQGLTFMAPYVDLFQRDTTTIGLPHCPEQGCYHVNPDPLSSEDNPLFLFELSDSRLREHDITAVANLEWRLASWMDVQGVFGLDRGSGTSTFFRPDGTTFYGWPLPGALSKSQGNGQLLHGSVTANLTRAFGDLTARTRLHYLQRSGFADNFTVEGQDFQLGSVPHLDNLDYHRGRSSRSDDREEGYLATLGLDYRGRYILDGLVRRDGSSVFGRDQRWHTYSRTSVAWRASQESWWPFRSAVNEFKVRGSRGSAGRRPPWIAQYETYALSRGSIYPNRLGNMYIRPQEGVENEFGVDMVLFGAAAMSISYATTTNYDQILTVPLPQMTGYRSQIQNAGTLRSNTWEYSVDVPILRGPDLSWNVRLNLDRSIARIVKLNREPWHDGFFYYREGEVMGALNGVKWATSCDDLPAGVPCDQFRVNDDGLVVWTGGAEYTEGMSGSLWGTDSSGQTGSDIFEWGMPIHAWGECETRRAYDPGCTNLLELGNTTPDFNFGFMSSFRWRGLSVYALLDGQYGGLIQNATRQRAYRSHRSPDQDQAGKPDEMKKPVAYYQALYARGVTSSWFSERGDHIKLREVSVRYRVRPEWLDSFFGGRVTDADINLIGRNLLTITNYLGYDPEVGTGLGGSAVVGRIDSYGYPNYATFSAGLRLVF